MVMPGIIQVLTVSPCNSFCVGALGEQLMVWQLSTGRLVASLRRHYQNVTGVQFTADSSRFVSAGAEGLVLLWSLEMVMITKVSHLSNCCFSCSNNMILFIEIRNVNQIQFGRIIHSL